VQAEKRRRRRRYLAAALGQVVLEEEAGMVVPGQVSGAHGTAPWKGRD
jgi:hypothetical protein